MGIFNSKKKIGKTYKLILDNFLTCAILIDKDGIIKYINKPCEILFGYSIEELINNDINKLVPMNFRKQHSGYLHYKEFKSLTKHAIGEEKVIKGEKKNGVIFLLDIRLNPVYIGKEILNLVLCYEHKELQFINKENTQHTDKREKIAERTERAERVERVENKGIRDTNTDNTIDIQKMRSERNEYNNIDISSFEVYIKDNMVFSCEIHQEKTGLNEFDTLQNHFSIIHKDDIDKVKLQLKLCILSKQSVQLIYRIRTPERKYIFLYTKGTPYIENDKVIKIVGTCNDVTNSNNLQNIKDFSENLLGLLISQINVCKLLENIKLETNQNEYVEWIDDYIKVYLVILNNIINLSRIEKNMELNSKNINIRELINDIKESFDNYHLRLIINIDEKLSDFIYCDFYKLTEIILNLLDNSIKIGKNSDIRLNVEIISNYLSIKISINDSKSYETFQSNIKFDENNSGLGICKKLTRYMNGDIDYITNEKTSSFLVSIPIKDKL